MRLVVNVSVAVHTVRTDIEVSDQFSPAGNEFTDALRPFNKELAMFGTRRTPRQASNHFDPVTSRVRQVGHVWAFGNRCVGHRDGLRYAAWRGALTSSGRAAFATVTRALNALMSLTASSARTRRSTSTPAALSPLDKTVIGHTLGAGCSIDALDPQATEVPFTTLTVAVVVDQ